MDRRGALLTLATAACASARRVVAPPPAPCVERATRSGLPAAAPDAAGLRRDALATLLERARATGSHGLVILRGGAVVVEEYFGHGARPLCAMSVSKSVTALAIGAMVRGSRTRLDEAMVHVFPAWRTDHRKRKITVQHVLAHTSGLDVTRASFSSGQTIAQAAERAPMHHHPGMDFRYNNAAVDLLAAFVREKTGLHLDDWLHREVFGPVGVRGAWWAKDRAGHPRAAGELFITPLELAKLGQLMLQDGVWEGRRVLPHDWVSRSIAPGQPFRQDCGLLWWLHGARAWSLREELFASWEEAGVPQSVIARVRPLVGRSFASPEALDRARDALLTPDARRELPRWLHPQRVEASRVALAGPVEAYCARGQAGQWVVVAPARGVVAVRMRRESAQDRDGSRPHEYAGFVDDVLAL